MGRLSLVDWRANRLVDAVAQRAAVPSPVAFGAKQFLCNAETLVRHEAVAIGLATRAAIRWVPPPHAAIPVRSGGLLLRSQASLAAWSLYMRAAAPAPVAARATPPPPPPPAGHLPV